MAITPDGTWLATVGDDGTLRIWDPAAGGNSTVMRVDSRLEDCVWSPSIHRSSQSIVAVGRAGLYPFTFKS